MPRPRRSRTGCQESRQYRNCWSTPRSTEPRPPVIATLSTCCGARPSNAPRSQANTPDAVASRPDRPIWSHVAHRLRWRRAARQRSPPGGRPAAPGGRAFRAAGHLASRERKATPLAGSARVKPRGRLWTAVRYALSVCSGRHRASAESLASSSSSNSTSSVFSSRWSSRQLLSTSIQSGARAAASRAAAAW